MSTIAPAERPTGDISSQDAHSRRAPHAAGSPTAVDPPPKQDDGVDVIEHDMSDRGRTPTRWGGFSGSSSACCYSSGSC